MSSDSINVRRTAEVGTGHQDGRLVAKTRTLQREVTRTRTFAPQEQRPTGAVARPSGLRAPGYSQTARASARPLPKTTVQETNRIPVQRRQTTTRPHGVSAGTLPQTRNVPQPRTGLRPPSSGLRIPGAQRAGSRLPSGPVGMNYQRGGSRLRPSGVRSGLRPPVSREAASGLRASGAALRTRGTELRASGAALRARGTGLAARGTVLRQPIPHIPVTHVSPQEAETARRMGPVSRLEFEEDVGVDNVPVADETGATAADIVDPDSAESYAHRASADVPTLSRRTNLVALAEIMKANLDIKEETERELVLSKLADKQDYRRTLMLSSMSPQQQEETDPISVAEMDRRMREQGYGAYNEDAYFLEQDEMLDDIDLDVVLEEEDEDIVEDIEQLEEFFAGGPRPEQSWYYSPTSGRSRLSRRTQPTEMDDLIDLDFEEPYSDELYRLLRF